MKELDRKLKRKIGALGVLGILILISLIPISYAAPNWTETGGDISDDGSYYIDVDADSTDADHDEVFAVTKHGGGSVGTELFRVQETGEVGIGDTSPDFKLEVTGSSDNGYFGVSSSDDEGDNGDVFIIDSNGKVGIGQASPSAKLDVVTSSGGAAEIGTSGNSASGVASIAMGGGTTASGDYSTAMGWSTTASGDCSIAGGVFTIASDDESFAFGLFATADGAYSTAIGHMVTASASNSYVFGRGSWVGGGELVNNIQKSFMVGFDSTTPTLFVDGSAVGIGTTTPTLGKLQIDTAPAASCALYIANPMGMATNNGAINIGGRLFIDEDEIQSAVGRTLYINNDNDVDLIINNGGGDVGIGTSSPSAKLDVETDVSEGGAATIGSSLCSATGDYAVAVGYNADATGTGSFAMGFDTLASGDYSIAMGGDSTVASNSNSVAIGYQVDSTGLTSVGIGMDADATATYAGAWGAFVTASSSSSYIIGRGEHAGSKLVNNIASSFMVGFDSTTPTFFVDGSSVGIATTSPVTTLDVNGGFASNIKTKTADYTINSDSTDDFTILADGSSNSVTITLPAASSVTGQIIVIKAIDVTNTVDIDPNGSEIDGDSSNHELSSQYDSIMIQSDGSNWYKI